ncbi:MAG: hypothetical protein FD133_694 [Erysipelotrichaceae bacterium]|nr:MAG: hypothetical protein FD133_694 [Erysipelotrichaceae bacterium]
MTYILISYDEGARNNLPVRFSLLNNDPFIEQYPFPFLVKKKKDAPPIFFLFYGHFF